MQTRFSFPHTIATFTHFSDSQSRDIHIVTSRESRRNNIHVYIIWNLCTDVIASSFPASPLGKQLDPWPYSRISTKRIKLPHFPPRELGTQDLYDVVSGVAGDRRRPLRINPYLLSSDFRVTGNEMKDLRLTSPGGHSTQRLISPVGHLRVASLNDHRVSSPSDSEIRVHSPSKYPCLTPAVDRTRVLKTSTINR